MTELPTPDEIAPALAAIGSLEELDGYADGAVRRGLAPGESAAVTVRRFQLLDAARPKGRRT